MRLYRYICFEEFINLFVNKKERFVRPSSWDDKYEGYSFSLMETSEDVRKMIERMYYDLCSQNYYAIAGNMAELWHAKWFTYAQCWSKVGNSDSMWRAYSYDKRSIRIRTTDKKLAEHLSCIDDNRYSKQFAKVSYDVNSKTDILKQQIEQLRVNKKVYEPYFHKRRVFSYEKEYRVVIIDNESYFEDYLLGQGIKFTMEKGVRGLCTDKDKLDFLCSKIMEFRSPWNRMSKDIDDTIYFENISIKDYIEGVMVHPLAPKWYGDIVKDICGHSEIKCEGISDIYVRS